MKKKTPLLFISIVGLLIISVFIYGTGRPGYGDTHDTCHDSTGYTIGTTAPGEITITASSNIIFNITSTGVNLFVQIVPGAKDNSLFVVSPTTDRINETSIYDLDPNPNSILVVFNLTTPANNGYYTIFIIAGNDAIGQINFAYQQININVGGVVPPGFELSSIFDHLGLYLGLPALLLVTLGTVLVLINENKFVKVHGILAGGSLILTVINLTAAIIKIPVNTWFGVYPLVYHVPHIILGLVGLVAGFFSLMFGISAERKPAKISGYITLLCWWTAFFLGYFLNRNLLLL
jgi:hypothetical protein